MSSNHTYQTKGILQFIEIKNILFNNVDLLFYLLVNTKYLLYENTIRNPKTLTKINEIIKLSY